jgi:hypothetical protein
MNVQKTLPFGSTPHWATARFDGADCTAKDQARLTGQILRVYNLMRDGKWRTLDTIAVSTGDPSPSVSAQLRNLRKARFGGHTIERFRRSNGLYSYRLILP